jgi:predicted ester cyclase
MTDEIAAPNKALVRKFYKEVFGEWNMDMVDEVVSPRFRSHDWPPDSKTGPQGLRDFYSGIKFVVPDGKYEVDDLVAEGDKVVVRWRLVGTHKGTFQGIAPTGRPVTLKGIAIYRLENGKLMERWVVSDVYGVLQELGAVLAH